MPGGITGLFNIFEIDATNMMINFELFYADIQNYGLFTYEEFSSFIDIPEEIFNAFNGQYLKVAIGKHLITIEELENLTQIYADFFV